MIQQIRGLTAILLIMLVYSLTDGNGLRADEEAAVLMRINGEEITRGDVNQALRIYDLQQRAGEKTFEQMKQRLVERTLIRQFLDSRGVEAPEYLLERQMSFIEKILQQEGDAEATLERLQITREQIRNELALPLAWQQYVRQVVTESEIQDYFEQNRAKLDGTKRTARQIFLKLERDASDAAVEKAREKLQSIRRQIEEGKVSFEEAAGKYSEAPSAEEGGRIGKFAYRGQMPHEIADVAFSLDVDELSEPFRTRYGMHLLQVTDEVPGQLSLEDARPQIMEHFQEELWVKRLNELRAKAEIESR